MSAETSEANTKYQQLRDLLFKYSVPPEDTRVLSTDTSGTHVMVYYRTQKRWAFYLVTDLTSPSKASSTHLHEGLLSNSAVRTNVSISAQSFTDIVTTTYTVPTGLPGGTFVLTVYLFAWGSANISAGTGTYDLKILDKTANSGNSIGGFNHTDILPAGIMTEILLVNPASGSHTVAVQAQTSVSTTTVTFASMIIAVLAYITQKPVAGT